MRQDGEEEHARAEGGYGMIAVSMHNPALRRAVAIYDTTLRDGEQMPGVRFSPEQKLEIALALEEAGVREIEAGFPAVSEEEAEAVKLVAANSGAKVSALARLKREDIDAAAECGVHRVVLFAPASELLLRHKLRVSFEELLELSMQAVEYARQRGLMVSFSAEDATRAPLERLLLLYSAAAGAGAGRLHVADTAGAAAPEAVERIIGALRRELRAELCVHCHNDFGLATANTLAGVKAGAELAAVTVNGIGERAGNAALEEVAAALEMLYGVRTGIRLERLGMLSELVRRCSGVEPQPHKAVVGRNAFAHESGVHVAAVLCNPLTYEPYLPELVGAKRRIVLGKHSGRKAVAAKLQEMGVRAGEKELRALVGRIKGGALLHSGAGFDARETC